MTTMTTRDIQNDVQGYVIQLTAPAVAGMMLLSGAAGVAVGATAAVAGIAAGNAMQAAAEKPSGPKIAPGT